MLAGHTTRFVEARDMLADLHAQDDPVRFRRRLHKYTSPALLVVDEVGYMSYAQGYADLLFQVVNQRSRGSSPLEFRGS